MPAIERRNGRFNNYLLPLQNGWLADTRHTRRGANAVAFNESRDNRDALGKWEAIHRNSMLERLSIVKYNPLRSKRQVVPLPHRVYDHKAKLRERA